MARIDIIIPTCNRASVLPETLKSVQSQTFSDWKCFIAEDGETPDTRAAVAPFLVDPRFSYLPGAHAGVPAAPRNRAIARGAAPLIAFLDDDDLWLPGKLAAQVEFMQQHPACALLGANARRWSGRGSMDAAIPFFTDPPSGRISFETLVAENRIINSTAVVRRAVFERSGALNEAPGLALCEDYELWLRIASLGEVWVMGEELAIYRDAPHDSIRKGLTPRRNYKKLKFVYSAALSGSHAAPSPLTLPENRSLAAACRDRLAALQAQERRRVRLLFTSPLTRRAKIGIISFGRMLGMLLSCFFRYRDRSRPSIFMMLPYYHTGGAERVHAEIISCLHEYRPWIIVLRTSLNAAFKKEFARNGRLFDLSWLLERKPNRILFLIVLNFLTELMNRAQNPVVFGCQAPLFYDMLPLLSQNVKKVDLIHAFDGLERYALPSVRYLDARVGINRKILEDLGTLYAQNGIDPAYLGKVRIIENRTEIPLDCPVKTFDRPTVLYVGRGTAEKRVHLVSRIAKSCLTANPEICFVLAGDVYSSIPAQERQYCVFAGEIVEREKLNTLYRQANLLILTSEREGMPLVIMEAMAHGVVPITTDVGGIGEHIENGVNGFLIKPEGEEALVAAFAGRISALLRDREQYALMSRNARRYAMRNFANDAFCSSYADVLASPKAKA